LDAIYITHEDSKGRTQWGGSLSVPWRYLENRDIRKENLGFLLSSVTPTGLSDVTKFVQDLKVPTVEWHSYYLHWRWAL
jgi:hypothetical protein